MVLLRPDKALPGQACTCCAVHPTRPATLCLAAPVKWDKSFRSSGSMALQSHPGRQTKWSLALEATNDFKARRRNADMGTERTL